MTTGPERAGFAEMAGRDVLGLYGDAMVTLLDKVGKRLARGVDSPGWAEAKLAQLAQLHGDLGPLVARLDKDAAARAVELIQRAHDLGAGSGLVQTNTRAVEALAADLTGKLTDANQRILRWADDAYRQVVAEAVTQTATGAMSLREATQLALAKFAERGVTGFVDTTGATWRLESYADMAVRTATMRAHLQGTVERLRSNGFELVHVIGISRSCPLCRPWEGSVLSLTGADPLYPTVAVATGAGLFHANCRHDLQAFTDGLTQLSGPVGEPDDFRVLARQRELERRVRASKQRLAAAGPLGDTRRLAYEKRLLAARQAALRQHVDRHGLKGWVSRQRTQLRGPAPTPAARPSWRPTMTRAQADRWAADSALDIDLFHGTTTAGRTGIEADGFKLDRLGGNTGNGGALGAGHYFGASPDLSYANQGERLTARARVRNPVSTLDHDYVRSSLAGSYMDVYTSTGREAAERWLDQPLSPQDAVEAQTNRPSGTRRDVLGELTQGEVDRYLQAMDGKQFAAAWVRRQWLLDHGYDAVVWKVPGVKLPGSYVDPDGNLWYEVAILDDKAVTVIDGE